MANGEGRSPSARPEARRREAGVERAYTGAGIVAAGTRWWEVCCRGGTKATPRQRSPSIHFP